MMELYSENLENIFISCFLKEIEMYLIAVTHLLIFLKTEKQLLNSSTTWHIRKRLTLYFFLLILIAIGSYLLPITAHVDGKRY